VIKARIFGKKESGGKVELLFNKPLNGLRYLVMIKGKVKVGTELFLIMGLWQRVLKLTNDGFHRIVKVLDTNH